MEKLLPCGVPSPLLALPQTITGAWVNIGPQIINVKSATAISVWADFSVGGHRDIRFRAQALPDLTTTAYDLPIQIIEPDVVRVEPEYFEFTNDVDTRLVFQVSIGDLVPYITLQVMAGNTTGAPATLNSVLVGSTDGGG